MTALPDLWRRWRDAVLTRRRNNLDLSAVHRALPKRGQFIIEGLTTLAYDAPADNRFAEDARKALRRARVSKSTADRAVSLTMTEVALYRDLEALEEGIAAAPALTPAEVLCKLDVTLCDQFEAMTWSDLPGAWRHDALYAVGVPLLFDLRRQAPDILPLSMLDLAGWQRASIVPADLWPELAAVPLVAEWRPACP